MARCGDTQIIYESRLRPGRFLIRDKACGKLTCPVCCYSASEKLERQIIRYAREGKLYFFATITSGLEDGHAALEELQTLFDKIRKEMSLMHYPTHIQDVRTRDGKKFKQKNAERRYTKRLTQFIESDIQYGCDNWMRAKVIIDIARKNRVHYKRLSPENQRQYREEHREEINTAFEQFRKNVGLSDKERAIVESNVKQTYQRILDQEVGELKFVRIIERGDNGHYHFHILTNYPLPHLLIKKHATETSRVYDCQYIGAEGKDDKSLKRLSDYITKLARYATKFERVIECLGDRDLVSGSNGYNLMANEKASDWHKLYRKVDEVQMDTGHRSLEVTKHELDEYLNGKRLPKTNLYAMNIHRELLQHIPKGTTDDRLRRIRDALYIRRHISEDKPLPVVYPDWNNYSGLPLTDEQRLAVQHIGAQKYNVILGPAGVGKTSVVPAIMQCYGINPGETLILSHLGRASLILKNKLPSEYHQRVYTVRKALGWVKGAGYRRGYRNIIQGLKLIIIDEISMLPLHDMARILQSVPEDTRFVILGDDSQIPEFDGSNLAYEMRMLPGVHVSQLTTNHRSVGNIVTMSRNLLNGELPPYSSIDTDKLAQMAIDGWQVICNVHRVADEINEKVRKLQGIELTIEARDMWFGIGDKIMFTFNNYAELNDFRNGQTGTIIGVDGEFVLVDSNNELYTLSKKQLLDEECLEPAWAVTVNKVQGSEFPRVAVVVADLKIDLDDNNAQISKNLLYTAVTRAQQKIQLFADDKSVSLVMGRDMRRPVIDAVREWYDFCISRGLPISIKPSEVEQWIDKQYGLDN